MVTISKELFYEKISQDVKCTVIHYWSKNCAGGAFSPYVIKNIIVGAGTFFLPVYLLRMYLDYKRKNKNVVKRFVLNEIRAILYGISLGGTLIMNICLFKKLFGRIHYYNLIFMPAFISGFSLLIVSHENQVLNTLLFFNSFIETLLNKWGISSNKEVFLFMGLSGMLMYLLENRTEKIDFTYFWFYTPPLREHSLEEIKNSCQHEATCQSNIFNGALNYFLVGYGINATRSFLSNFKILPKYPRKFFQILFNKSNLTFGLFIGAYVGIYKFISCYLPKFNKIKKKWHGLISGILAGCTYIISPTLQVTVLAITTILQILYDIISKKFKITNHFYQRLLIFSFTHAYNLHNKFFFPETASMYYFKMVDACTNNVTKGIYENLISKYFM
ncbi:unnamed protein product [Psylliodes chrysocephalus]|uniref:Transmembrane protein 135 N-terminal domain-containing protein n=1 Tax=Psylliodes chrysocephalus TaxID=3402493 RepID=A0A9P0G6J8_9CUCU|nr:unnamed protein product [Psylliodes chrysocephala]